MRFVRFVPGATCLDVRARVVVVVAEAAYEARRRTLPPVEERLHLLLIEIIFIYIYIHSFIHHHNDGHGPPTLLEGEFIQYTLPLS